MDDNDLVVALARSLHSGFRKDTTGASGNWSDLDESGRMLWKAMAQRAICLVDEMKAYDVAAAHADRPFAGYRC